jgi:hypothetical protein
LKLILVGSYEILNTEGNEKIDDISNLVKTVKEKYANFKNIPFSKLMPKIAKFKFRKKP